MATKIVIASGKGGVGKSTVCKGIGTALSEKGFRTLLIDCDAGLASLDALLCVEDKVVFSWHDIAENNCEAQDAVININENLALLPSPRNPLTEDFADDVINAVSLLGENYDYIITDAPAGLGRGLTRAAKASDKALIIATGDEISVKGAAAVDKKLRELGVTQSRLIINRYEIKAAKKGRLLTVDEIIDKTLVQLIGIIPEDKMLQYTTVSDKKLKTKKSDNAFSRITGRINGENVELQLSQLK